ncbi:hypothetical protein [Paenibacillus campi]|uniref:hypothetical protein n=1 Tax=Paenibacillus campi TaxID=3106031 RepID=UPI002AFF9EFD|nr:hypothetical protein [Paenibacillus sp. SGZ-1009]
MIERLFNSTSPIVLEDCYFLIDKTVVPLTRSFIFFKRNFMKLIKVGEDRISGRVRQSESIQGYFYSSQSIVALMSMEIDKNKIVMIGNRIVKDGEIQHKIKGISIEKTKNHMGEASYIIGKFSGLEHEAIYVLKEENKNNRSE